jgi:O-glycosyl hydrolase
VLRLSADDGEFQTHDDVSFDVAGLPGNVIALDADTKHQTITGWEATADAHQDYSPAWDSYKDELFDLAVNDLGLTRVRLEVRSGVESDQDYWTLWRSGQIGYPEWRARRYATVNDNGDPSATDTSRFHFSELDSVLAKVVLPLRDRVQASGERFHLNVCYVAFVDQIGTGLAYDHYDASEYAEFATATYRHLGSAHGIVPDSWEILLEPDNVPGWLGTTIGEAMAALGPRLIAAGFTPRFVAPSSASMARAVQQFDELASVPDALDHMVELSYHRYGGVSTDNLKEIQERARAHGLDTAHLEHIGADHFQLHQDLKVGGTSAWAQYVLATVTSLVPDDGTSYYVVDDSVPDAPVVTLGSRTHSLRQYIKYVRPGSVRIEATTTNADFDPVTFVRRDGGYVTVVQARMGGTFHVRDLPAGTYGISFTTELQKGLDAPDVTLIPGQILTATIPGPGVLTVHSKSPRRTHPEPVPEPARVTTYGCGTNPAGSLTLTGDASPGGTVHFHVDNPLGTQLPGSASVLLISAAPDPSYPCGTLLPGRGMSGPGAPGELLVQGGPSKLFHGRGPTWLGTGQPATLSIPIPARVQMIGAVGYAQGWLRDPVGPVRWGFTNGLRVEIGL